MLNFQEERLKLIDEIFDLFYSKTIGYVEIKDSIKILASISKKLDFEEENDFLSILDPKNEGRVTKDNFVKGVEAIFTLQKHFLQEIAKAFKFLIEKGKEKSLANN